MPSLIDISQAVVEKKIFKILLMYFRYFVIILLGRGRGCSFERMNHDHSRMLCAMFDGNLPIVLEEKSKMKEVYNQTDRHTDGRMEGQTDRRSESH